MNQRANATAAAAAAASPERCERMLASLPPPPFFLHLPRSLLFLHFPPYSPSSFPPSLTAADPSRTPPLYAHIPLLSDKFFPSSHSFFPPPIHPAFFYSSRRLILLISLFVRRSSGRSASTPLSSLFLFLKVWRKRKSVGKKRCPEEEVREER